MGRRRMINGRGEMPQRSELYGELLAAIQQIGPFTEEPKKTCVHLVRWSAFAGVHPRKEGFVLTLKAAGPVNSARIVKAEQTSAHRWHLDVRVSEGGDSGEGERLFRREAEQY